METRYQLACEIIGKLLASVPPGTAFDHERYGDYCRIAEAVERGDSRNAILNMPESEHWSDLVAWLKGKL
jgi:hypothetical protein